LAQFPTKGKNKNIAPENRPKPAYQCNLHGKNKQIIFAPKNFQKSAYFRKFST
jgi:hypothetical protein